MTNSTESIVKLSREEFNDLIKIIRMLYGVQVATKVFEKNANEFYNFSLETKNNLQKMSASYKIQSPRATNKIEVKNG